MKERKKINAAKICLWGGMGLLAIAVIVLVAWQWSLHAWQKQAEARVATLREVLPTPQDAVVETRRDNTMPVLAIEGTDFVGLLEIPRFDAALLIAAAWDNPARYPCRLGGSVYDRTLQIGATAQKGQCDFYRELSVGDTLLFTDVAGDRYTLEVTALRYAKHADQAALTREPAALTLFIKNPYAFEYLIVSSTCVQ